MKSAPPPSVPPALPTAATVDDAPAGETRQLVAKLLTTEQALIDLRHRRDREQRVLEGIVGFSERVLPGADPVEFWEQVVEAATNAFECESCLALQLEPPRVLSWRGPKPLADELAALAELAAGCLAEGHWFLAGEALAGLHLAGQPQASVLVAPIPCLPNQPQRVLLTAVSERKHAFFPTFDALSAPGLRMFASHVNVLHEALASRRQIAAQLDELDRSHQSLAVANEALASSEQRFRRLFTDSPDALFVFEGEQFVDCNPAAERMFGAARGELLGLSVTALSPEFQPGGQSSASLFEQTQPGFLAGGAAVLEWTHRRLDGSLFPAEVCLAPMMLGTRRVLFASLRDISERKRMEVEVARANERMLLAADAAGFGVWDLDLVTRSLVWDDWMFRLFGVERATFHGTFEDWRRTVHPDDLEPTLRAIEDALTGDGSLDCEFRVCRPDGELRYLKASAKVQHDADGQPARLTGINYDITERKRLESQLAEARRREEAHRYARLFRENPTPMVIVSLPDRRFYDINDAFLANSDYTREELLGRTSAELQSFVAAADEQLLAASLAAGERVHDFETRLRRRDGSELDVLLSGNTVRIEGQRYFLWALTDITARKQTEQQLQATNAQLQEASERAGAMARAAEQANVAKSEFLANMSHELRTPLNAILALSEALLEQVRGPLNPRQQAALQHIEASGRHLLELINDILDLAKVEAGRLEMVPETVQLADVCESSLAFVRELALNKGIELRFQTDALVTRLQADPKRLRQMLVNLLSNAVKFTPGGGRVTLAVEARLDRQALCFTVEDTGTGISAEDLPRLFQPFTQLDAGLSRAHEGTGLGLALVARLAELHGGSVAVESRVGRGSRFSVVLPLGEPPAADGQRRDVARGQDGVPRQALIIEDSEIIAAQLAGYCEELTYGVTCSATGARGLAEARRLRPDLIILDLLLPDVSGWQLLAELKADTELRAIPVLVVSIVDEPQRALAAGAVGHLLKPISREELRQALAPLASAASRPAAAAEPRARLLLAEDNEANIVALRDYLQDLGYGLTVARNGREVLARVAEARPDLVLMDVQMPGMDGLEATRQLRQRPDCADLPVIVLTALAMPGDRERCLAAGATEYLTKPVRLKELVAAIEQLLPRTR